MEAGDHLGEPAMRFQRVSQAAQSPDLEVGVVCHESSDVRRRQYTTPRGAGAARDVRRG
jgi:hypothetical protein